MTARYAPSWYLAIALLALFALVTSGFDVSEGVEHAEWARAIVHRGQVGLVEPLSPNWVQGLDGRHYSAHEIGNAVALIPVVFTGERLRRFVARRAGEELAASVERALLPMAAAVYVVLTLVAFYRLSIDALDVRPTTAILATTALGTTTILFPYSRMLFDGVLGGMLVAWSLVWGHAAARKGSAGFALVAGIAIAAAIATRQTLGVFLIPLLAILLWQGSRSPMLMLWFLIGCMPALLWQGWYNTLRTGVFYLPAATLPQFQNLSADGSIIEGLAGLLISPGKSLFLFSPLLLLSLVGARAFARKSWPLALGILLAATIYVLVHASIRNWAGEWGWGPRYLVPLTLPLALPAVLVLERARDASRAIRGGVAVVLAGGLVVQAAAILSNWHYRYAWLQQEGLFDLKTLAWSIRGNQFVETVRMLAENITRLVGGSDIPLRIVHGASPATQAASNSINIWPVTALREGVPLPVVVLTCLVLTTVGVIAARAAIAKARALDFRTA